MCRVVYVAQSQGYFVSRHAAVWYVGGLRRVQVIYQFEYKLVAFDI